MQVQVSGKHMAVGEALTARITDELNAVIGRYFERGGINAEVVVAKDGHDICVETVVRLASGQQLDSHGSGPDAHSAFDAAVAKIETRVRRYKRRLKSHRHPIARESVETTSEVVLRAPDLDGEAEEVWDVLAESGLTSHEPPSGVIIAETQAPLRTMTVSMAVMELDLTESQTIVFRNAAHGGLSVVYRRSDGNIGWIDPERTKPMAGAGA
jgi:ribosomal subunit interface protein